MARSSKWRREFESCRKLADQASVPIKEIYAAALRAFPK